jgi:hypothetical protein
VTVEREEAEETEPASSAALWAYTLLLSIVQSALILAVWYFLRV